MHGRDHNALAAVHGEIVQNCDRAIQVAGDVTKFADLEAMRGEIEKALGPVDILVTNAGGSATEPSPIEEISEEGWHASVNRNLTATFLTIKCFLPGMKRRKSGNIVTMSSASGRKPHPMNPVPYAAAKAGIQALTQTVAAQVGEFGIRINCLAPETILTEKNAQWIPEDVKAGLAREHPLQRLGTPEDVAQAALFLASDQSAWMTGVILDVAGGAVMV